MPGTPTPSWEQIAKLDPRAVGAIRASSEQRSRTISFLAAELRDLLTRVDPVQIAARTNMLTLVADRRRDFVATFGSEARVQYLVQSGLSTGARASSDPTPADIQAALNLVHSLFTLEHFEILCGATGVEHFTPETLLRLELLLDRFHAYTPHLHLAIRSIFEPLRTKCERALGWSPADLPLISSALGDVLRERMASEWMQARARVVDAVRMRPNDIASTYESAMAPLATNLLEFDAPDVAARCGLDAAVVDRALTSLSSRWRWDDQPPRPTQLLEIRRYGAVHLQGQTYFIGTPSTLIQEVFQWFADLVRRENLPELERAYHRRRDDATEEIASGSLTRIFGSSEVFRSVRYVDEDQRECESDVLVRVPGDALVVECKAHGFSDPGRRGAPKRVGDRTKKLVEVPTRQGHRTAEALLRGAQFNLADGSVVPHSCGAFSAVPRLSVSFERVDPVMTWSAKTAITRNFEATWSLTLFDLLVVAELLSDPASFWTYARTRCEIASSESFLSLTEATLLALFIDDGDVALRSLADERDDVLMVEHSYEGINDYFVPGHADLRPAPKPEVSTPIEVRAALRREFASSAHGWTGLVHAVFSQPSTTWRRLHNVLRRVRRSSRSRTRMVDSEDPPLRLIVGQDSRHEPGDAAPEVPQLQITTDDLSLV